MVLNNRMLRIRSNVRQTRVVCSRVQHCVVQQALAKRGLNVDMLTVYYGPGGVGLSLITSFLDSMYGEKNHKFFDPNIFYVDDDLRKVVELLIGGCIFSAQERPTGQKGFMREDLLRANDIQIMYLIL